MLVATQQGFRTRLHAQLASAAKVIPSNWAIVPVDSKKAPCLGKGWQHNSLTAEAFVDYLQSPAAGRCSAMGILSGVASGGLLFVDRDGASADKLIEGLSGVSLDEALPKTVAFSSGKLGRSQWAYTVPEKFWGEIARKSLSTGVTGPDGKIEGLDFRWGTDAAAFQSVVAGHHPETSGYRWVDGQSPTDVEVAEAPLWMIETMLADEEPAGALPLDFAPPPIASPSTFQYPRSWSGMSNLSAPFPDAIPLEVCLPVADRSLLNAGVGDGLKNETALKIGLSLVGLEEYLTGIGQRFDGTAKQLFWHFCDRCGKIDERRRNELWAFVGEKASGVTPSMKGQQIETCARAWIWKEIVKPSLKGVPEKTVHQLEKAGRLEDEEDRYAQYRERLMVILATYEGSEQRFRLRELASLYSLPSRHIELDISELSERREQFKKSYSLNELMALPEDATQWLVDGLIPRGGLILETAKAKTGKTLLAYEAADAVARGGQFLGFQAAQGKVLLIQAEEGLGTIRRRLMGKGMDAPGYPQHNVVIEKDLDITKPEEFEALIQHHRPQLVIIDSLRKTSRRSEVDENSQKFAQPVYAIDKILQDHNISGILIHHSNKNKEARGIDTVAGTSALSGACWGIWNLTRIAEEGQAPKEDDPNRLLSLVVREGMGRRFHLKLEELEGDMYEWVNEGEHNVDLEQSDLENRITHLIKQNTEVAPDGLTAKEIAHYLHIPETKKVYRPLNRLTMQKRISRIRDNKDGRVFKYSVPSVKLDNSNLTPPQNLTPPPPTDWETATNSTSTPFQRKVQAWAEANPVKPGQDHSIEFDAEKHLPATISQPPSNPEPARLVLNNNTQPLIHREGGGLNLGGGETRVTQIEEEPEILPITTWKEFSVGDMVRVDHARLAQAGYEKHELKEMASEGMADGRRGMISFFVNKKCIFSGEDSTWIHVDFDDGGCSQLVDFHLSLEAT